MSRVKLLLIVLAMVQLTAALAGLPLPAAAQLSPPERTDEEIAGRSTDIFIARIEQVVGYGIAKVNELASVSAFGQMDCPSPCVEYMTHYEVTVLEVIKGFLHPGDVVVVEQNGGEVDGDASFYEGDGPMRPGEEYLFATHYIGGAVDWYSIVGPGQGNVLLGSPEQRQAKVDRWRQILLETPCALTDVLMLNGTVYGRKDFTSEQPYLERSQVGKTIATVKRTVPGVVPCRDDLVDGDATLLTEGTEIQAVKGYDPSFRLAVRRPDGNRYLFEALWSLTASTAADLYDIHGRVVSISASMYVECWDFEVCKGAPRPRDNTDVERVVDLMLASPVDPTLIVRAAYAGTHPGAIVFHLDDGSSVVLWVGGYGGETLNGVKLHYEISRELWAT
jgi:hypothetical protein